jgi:plastocyanin
MLIGISLFARLDWLAVSRATIFSPMNQVASASPTGTTEVRIEGFAFTLGNLTIQAGMTVRWENFDALSHTVASANPTGIFNSGPLGKGR